MRIYSTQPSSLMICSRWIPFQMRKRCTKCTLLTIGLCSDLAKLPMAEPASILSLEQLKNQNTMGCFSFVIPEPFDSII